MAPIAPRPYQAWLEQVWPDYLEGLACIRAKVGPRDLLAHLWDGSTGALKWYPNRNNVHPQSANSLAVVARIR